MDRMVGCIDGSGRGIIEKQQVAPPAPGQVQVEVSASLISPGTELGRVAGMRQAPKPDNAARAFGYACAGRVVAAGDGVDTTRVGARVACMGASYAQHANINNVPVNLTALIPDQISDEEGAFAHLAATALHAIRRAAPVPCENAMVTGLGLVGQMASQLAQSCGGHALGVDRMSMRVELARACGIELVVDASQDDPVPMATNFSCGWGMDYGIIAFGGNGTPAFEQIVASLKVSADGHQMGRVVIVGGARIEHGFASALGNVDVRSASRTGPGYHDEAYEHGQEYPRGFVEWPTRRNLDECLRAIVLGRLRVEPLITHRFPLSRIGDAIDELVERPDQALGVVLQPGA